MALTVEHVQILNSKEVKLTVQEMRDGATYELTVSNVQDINGDTIDPANATAEFIGIGTLPQVVSIAKVDVTHLSVLFDEVMADDANFINAANYAVTGQSTPGVVGVARSVDGLTATLELDEDLETGTYGIAVENVVDAGGNLIDGAHDYAETAIVIGPWRDHASLGTNLVAHYKMEDETDSSDNGYDGAYESGTPGSITGKIGNALSFVPSVRMNIPANAELNALNAFTMAGWFKITTIAGSWHTLWGRTGQVSMTVVGSGDHIGKAYMGIYVNPPTYTLRETLTSTTAPENEWCFIVGSFNGSTATKVHINGVVRGTASFTSTTLATVDETHPWRIAIAQNNTEKNGNEDMHSPLAGGADELTVWGRELTQPEIDYLYNSGAGRAF